MADKGITMLLMAVQKRVIGNVFNVGTGSEDADEDEGVG